MTEELVYCSAWVNKIRHNKGKTVHLTWKKGSM